MTEQGAAAVLAALVDGAPMAAAVVGADGTVRHWNRRAEELLGWSREEAVGGADPSVPAGQEQATAERVAQLRADPALAQRGTVTRVRPDGTEVELVVEGVEQVELHDGPGLALWFAPATGIDAKLADRNQLSRQLVDATRAEDALPVLTGAVTDLLGAVGGVVLRRCPTGEHLHGLWGLGMEQADAEAVVLDADAAPWDGALEGRVVDGTLDTSDGRLHARFVPMGPDGQGWVLVVLSPRPLEATVLARQLAAAVADEAWIALQRADLVNELDGKIEILEATNAIAASVGLDLDDTLVAVTSQAAAALSCQRAAVYLVEDDGAVSLAHVHATDAAPASLLGEGEGLALAQEVVGSGARVLRQDTHGSDLAGGPWHADTGTIAVLGLPMTVGARTVGALVLAHTIVKPRGFTSLCLQVGDAVAQQAGLAVEHARLFEVERRTVQRLRELDRMKADWMAGLTHDLKAPLTGLLGFVETLRRLTGHVSPEQQHEFLRLMSRQAEQLVSLVEDLLLSARIDADAVARRRELVAVDELVEDAVATMAPTDRDRVELRLDAVDATVLADRMHVLRVLQNLLSNAARHGAGGIAVSSTNRDGDVVVAVEDDGPGVPVDDRERIFERFQHGGAEGSTGLGLYVARGIAVAHGGQLGVTGGEVLGGARFELVLPRSRRQREADLAPELPVGEDRRAGGDVHV